MRDAICFLYGLNILFESFDDVSIASNAMPVPTKAKAVLFQARKVRSLAR